ncbi:MAG: hypothetical protein Q7T20_11025 [Saprospiraceae bacterium]|nr:hypothetical protein [Saprospiraceae bacterium]
MDKLSQLQRRKAELETQIEQQRVDLKNTFVEFRKEIEPGNLLKKAVTGALGFSKSKPGEENTNVLSRLPAPISFLVDVLVRDPKWALGLKLLTPVVLKFVPSLGRPKGPALPALGEGPIKASLKTKIYSKLRNGISGLRVKLKRSDKGPGIVPVIVPDTINQLPEN